MTIPTAASHIKMDARVKIGGGGDEEAADAAAGEGLLSILLRGRETGIKFITSSFYIHSVVIFY